MNTNSVIDFERQVETQANTDLEMGLDADANIDFAPDPYEQYAAQFSPKRVARNQKRRLKTKIKHVAKKSQAQIIEEIVDQQGLEGGFQTTYQPGRYEEGWLLSSVRAFYEQTMISDILAQVKGGKEASVYCCLAHPTIHSEFGMELVAAKVYRPRQFRNLRNDRMYREGRNILSAEGKAVKSTDRRAHLAVAKKSSFGADLTHTSWLMHEYAAMSVLYEAGAAVPQPISASENAILMGYCGDIHQAAPTLHDSKLPAAEAKPLLDDVLHNIELMLQHGWIHGDLSAYNILYWAGAITLIDFPQVTEINNNPNAFFILQRDIQRVCEFFIRKGVRCDPEAIAEDLWERHASLDAKVPMALLMAGAEEMA